MNEKYSIKSKIYNQSKLILNKFIPLYFKNNYTYVHHFINNDNIKTNYTLINYLSFYYPKNKSNCQYKISIFDNNGQSLGSKWISMKPYGSKLIDPASYFGKTLPKCGMFSAKIYFGSPLNFKAHRNIERLDSPFYATFIQNKLTSIEVVHTLNKLNLPSLPNGHWISKIKINPEYLNHIDVHQINPSSEVVNSELNILSNDLSVLDKRFITLNPYGSRIERYNVKNYDSHKLLSVGVKGLTGRNAKPLLMFYFKDGTFSGCHS